VGYGRYAYSLKEWTYFRNKTGGGARIKVQRFYTKGGKPGIFGFQMWKTPLLCYFLFIGPRQS